MTQGDECKLVADEAQDVLDRLTALPKVISQEAVEQVALDSVWVQKRACKLTPTVTLWIVLAMGVLTDLPIRQVFKHARRLRIGELSPTRAALCVARKRLGVAPVRTLFFKTVRPLAMPATIGAFYKSFHLVGVAGVIYNTPDTLENERAFGRPSGGNRSMLADPRRTGHDEEHVLPECTTQTPQAFHDWYKSLLWEMQQEVLEPRRNRINPRVIKQKIMKWPKKQPKHKAPPKLTKTFEESVIIC